MTSLPRISMVVPAFNEAHHLPLLLDSIELARQRYAGDADDIEVIVADNASTDGTAHLARTRECRVVRVERRSIAAARNGGANVAVGDVLAFVDADSRIHPETFNAIERTHLARLDTGVVFCRRADWQAVGGFEEHRLVAEDIQFQTAMKKLGRTRGQRFGRARGARTLSSARKFDRYGDWHYVTNAFRAGRWLLTGRGSFAGFIQRYWYEEPR